MTSINGYTKKYGLIGFFDVLGVKKMDAREFIPRFNRWRTAFSDYLERRKTNSPQKSQIILVPNLEDIRVLGDTVIMPFEIEEQYAHSHLNRFSLTLHFIIRLGLKEGLLFQGAISKGEYFISTSEHGIFGKAVNEAAEYYKKAFWGGLIIASPSGRIYSDVVLKNLASQDSGQVEGNLILEYDVPLKSGCSERMWTIGWPLYYELANRSNSNRSVKARNEFLRHLEKVKELCRQDEEAEPIYENTIKYYDDYCRNNSDFIERLVQMKKKNNMEN